MKVLVIGLVTMLTACGRFEIVEEHAHPTPTPIVETPVVIDEVQEDIDLLVAEENDYRLELGQTMLSPGLSCSVQEVSSGQRISSSSSPSLGSVITTTGPTYTYTMSGGFNQLNSSGTMQNSILPKGLRASFVGKNYVVRCNGFLVVRDTDYYSFELNSDDGSLLTVDNTLVVNNDGNHGMTLRTGSKFLRRGVRQFRLEYAQTGGGAFGIVLTSGGSLVDSKFFYH